MGPLKIYLLNAFHVEQDGRAITHFVTDKARALLAYLAMERRRPHRREQLAALLWPNQDDEHGRHSLRQALSHLRHTLNDSNRCSPPLFLVDRHAIQLNPNAAVWLDAAVCAELSEACRSHRHRSQAACLPCLHRLEQLVHLYAGDFLAGFFLPDSAPFEEWALLKREWLHCQAVEALAALADFYERRGDLTAARQMAQRQAQMEPWREEAHRQLMRFLAADGWRSAALAQYERCRRALLHELGVAPANETMALYAAIREDRYEWADAVRPEAAGLPQAPPPFVRRAAAQWELAEMLADPDIRLISLLGPTNAGKTGLALQVAADHLGLYADGVYWLELAASVASAASAAPPLASLARRLGLTLTDDATAESQLLAYLETRQILLVLNQADHLPGLANLIGGWLAHAPGLTLLVTARHGLGLRGERVYDLTAERVDGRQPSAAIEV
jgi:DNA-binding SARP family transcriptional activator